MGWFEYFNVRQCGLLRHTFGDNLEIRIFFLIFRSGNQLEFQKEKPKRQYPTSKQGSIPPEESRSPSASGSMENFDKFHKVATPPPAKKSGKSYASKRKERQQQKEKSKGTNPNDEGVLDLPSD